jgi:hypothetical protein
MRSTSKSPLRRFFYTNMNLKWDQPVLSANRLAFKFLFASRDPKSLGPIRNLRFNGAKFIAKPYPLGL